MSEFRHNQITEEAAQAIALGQLTDKQVAENADVAYSTLWNWKQHPEFQARIEHYLDEARRTVRSRGIGVLELRVRRLDDHWRRMQQVIEERAADPEMARAAGGSTGLLVRKTKMLGSGEGAMVIDEYEVDTALLKELREHEKQAAQELGQWTEKLDQSGQTTVTVRYVNNWRQNAELRDLPALPSSRPVSRPGDGDAV